MKPVDRWLGILGVVASLILPIIPRTELSVATIGVVIFALLLHPLWNFWWIEGHLARRVAAVVLLIVADVGMCWTAWPRTVPFNKLSIDCFSGRTPSPVTTVTVDPWTLKLYQNGNLLDAFGPDMLHDDKRATNASVATCRVTNYSLDEAAFDTVIGLAYSLTREFDGLSNSDLKNVSHLVIWKTIPPNGKYVDIRIVNGSQYWLTVDPVLECRVRLPGTPEKASERCVFQDRYGLRGLVQLPITLFPVTKPKRQ